MSNSQPALSKYTTLADREIDRAEAYSKESWGSPVYIFVAAAISALVVSLIFYLNFTNLFASGGVLGNLVGFLTLEDYFSLELYFCF